MPKVPVTQADFDPKKVISDKIICEIEILGPNNAIVLLSERSLLESFRKSPNHSIDGTFSTTPFCVTIGWAQYLALLHQCNGVWLSTAYVLMETTIQWIMKNPPLPLLLAWQDLLRWLSPLWWELLHLFR